MPQVSVDLTVNGDGGLEVHLQDHGQDLQFLQKMTAKRDMKYPVHVCGLQSLLTAVFSANKPGFTLLLNRQLFPNHQLLLNRQPVDGVFCELNPQKKIKSLRAAHDHPQPDSPDITESTAKQKRKVKGPAKHEAGKPASSPARRQIDDRPEKADSGDHHAGRNASHRVITLLTDNKNALLTKCGNEQRGLAHFLKTLEIGGEPRRLHVAGADGHAVTVEATAENEYVIRPMDGFQLAIQGLTVSGAKVILHPSSGRVTALIQHEEKS